MRAQRIANRVLVSTPDLLSYAQNSSWLPNPIDVDHFTPDPSTKPQSNAFTFETETSAVDFSLKYCRAKGFDLKMDVYDRVKKPIYYSEMPKFLRNFKIYVDVRYVNGMILENLSKTALESLACGLKVLNFRLEFVKDLPDIHKPKEVISNLRRYYEQI